MSIFLASAPTTFGIAVYPPGATFGPRHLRDWELVWLIEGDALYERDGEVHAAREGSMVLCRPGATDSFYWDTKRRTRHGYFHFLIDQAPATWPAPETWPLVRATDENDILRPLFRHLLTWAAQGDKTACQISLMHIIAAFVTGETSIGEVSGRALPEPVMRALQFIQERLENAPEQKIELPGIARAACVTPEHLCRLFKAEGQPSPVETVRLLRLDRAMTLLARSNYSVAEIACLCGFADAFHFSRRFKEVYGESPSQLRRAVQNGATPPLSPLTRTVHTSISDR
jgi:AraC-like DNA-binding protein